MGKVIKIPHCDWLPERARRNDTAQSNNILPKSKWAAGCTKFLFHKIFSVTVKRFSVIFLLDLLGWNEKTESINENENKENKSVDEFQEYM